MIEASKMFTKWELVLWDPIESIDGWHQLGNGHWWVARYQGRFFDFYLCAN
jgi:hypothetical protein